MKSSHFSNPDPFSTMPLLSLLPILGDLARLSNLKESFYARYERVAAIKRDSSNQDVNSKLLLTELAMLKQILQWLEVVPAAEEGSN